MTDWEDRLDEWQQREVELARLYVRDFDHFTHGHDRLKLVDKLANLLDEASAVEPGPDKVIDFTVLDVPYHSQWEYDAELARSDCGPACVEMVCEYVEPDVDRTTDDIMKHITGGADRGVWVKELQQAAADLYGVVLRRYEDPLFESVMGWIENGQPAIVLVWYGSFLIRMDRGYTEGHFMVVTGYDKIKYQGVEQRRAIIHDPDFYGANTLTQGAFIPVTEKHFMDMWNDYPGSRIALVPEVS